MLERAAAAAAASRYAVYALRHDYAHAAAMSYVVAAMVGAILLAITRGLLTPLRLLFTLRLFSLIC